MSNYYEILGVWRDASEDDIDLAAQALADHWKGALALNDPLAGDWLKIVEQARSTLIDPASREVYDRQLAAQAAQAEQAEETLIYSPGFPWRPYLCALLAVPIVLAAFVLILAAAANSGSLSDASSFADALMTTMIVASAVALPAGLIVLLIAHRGKLEQRQLRILEAEGETDPAVLSRMETANRLSEFTDVAVWVTWAAEVVVVGFWIWLVALLVGSA